MPSELPQAVQAAIQKALEAQALINIYSWILQKLTGDNDFYELMALYLKSYEDRAMKVLGEQLKDHRPVLKAAVLLKCWELLPVNRRGLADAGINPQFTETWLKKHILAQLVDRSPADIELALELYRERSVSYLDDKVNLLLPKTCLKDSSLAMDNKTPLSD